ncbi:hypothetical protein CYL31_14035 [Marinomonas sp. A3A]|nr:hypothetical protein CYL31_14035 [Marinomonas sp. A3A]
MTLKPHKVAQLRRVELTLSGFQAQKVTTTDYQAPSPFIFSKGKAEDGVALWVFKCVYFLSMAFS